MNVCSSTTTKHYGDPLPWIGIFIAGASLVLITAMAADLLGGLLQKRPWFPCRFFTLNAAYIAVIAVVVKIPMDLTTPMFSEYEQLSKLSGVAFMTTCMVNFMPSLATMNNKEILSNLITLGFVAVNVVVDVCIQVITLVIFGPRVEVIMAVILMFVQFILMVFTSLTIPTTKNHLDIKYRRLHNIIQRKHHHHHRQQQQQGEEEQFGENKSVVALKLQEDLKKYRMMAETVNPQFVTARSATSNASCIICFLISLVLLHAWKISKPCEKEKSRYGETTKFIFWIQTFGTILGAVPPTIRWFTAVKFRCSRKISDCYTTKLESTFKVEKYWTERLQNWKSRPLTLPVRIRKLKKGIHNARSLLLDFCIIVQILIVIESKIFQQCFVFIIGPFFFWFDFLKRKLKSRTSSDNPQVDLNLGVYVLHLDGEEELPQWFASTSNAIDPFIEMGRKMQHKGLEELLHKCTSNFKQMVVIDDDKIESLDFKKLRNCWSLTTVTLTSIVIALPKIENQFRQRLLGNVSKALFYVNIVEQVLDTKGDLIRIRDAADRVWFNVEVYRKWLTEDLKKLALEGRSSKETIKNLAESGKNYVVQFMTNNRNVEAEDPLNWPPMVIAANSMHKICQTILLACESDQKKTDEEVFEYIHVMIADTLGACLTNLSRAITMKCFSCALEKREESVRDSARLVGETEEILKILARHQAPELEFDKRICIDE